MTPRKLALLLAILFQFCIGAGGAGIPPEEQGPQKSPPPAVADLTPERLGMDRSQIVFSGRRLRLFNGRGTVAVRDWSVTGLQVLEFPPIAVHDYHFQLAFRDEKKQVLVQDLTADAHEKLATTGEGTTPLGFNFFPDSPWVMLLQQARWQPNLYTRTGTFHKVINGKWISFGIRTRASVSSEKDEVYLEVEILNRLAEPMSLTVIPQQSAPKLGVNIPGEKTPPPSAVKQVDAFTLASDQVRVTVASDLGKPSKDGWSWEIPAQGVKTARFVILPQLIAVPAPDPYVPDLAERIERADHALRARLLWAGQNYPRISTSYKPLDDLYYRSVLSVVDTRWERENFILNPFYAVGTWLFTIAWDTSYASELIAQLEPTALRDAFLNFVRSGLLTCTYIPWNGKAGEFAYAQDPFAKMQILQDYLRQTGDMAFLDRVENGASVYEWMKRTAVELQKKRARQDGLLDFGSNSNNLLEMRTDGYEHVVAATNGLAGEFFLQLAEWGRSRNDPDAEQFAQWAARLKKALNGQLWNEQAGWFDNLFPDGSHHQVMSYHLFDILPTSMVSDSQRQRLISHLTEGEFLGPNGLYSVSKSDETHWDWMDEDWGGGGQYTGMPLRIAERLYGLGYPELGWDILKRCARWTQHYPYLPQDAFTDSFGDLDEEDMPLEIAAGSGAQAILFGVFGVHPGMDGSLEVSPAYHLELGEARMAGYHFRGHTYDVEMTENGFAVYKDGAVISRNPYSNTVKVPRP